MSNRPAGSDRLFPTSRFVLMPLRIREERGRVAFAFLGPDPVAPRPSLRKLEKRRHIRPHSSPALPNNAAIPPHHAARFLSQPLSAYVQYDTNAPGQRARSTAAPSQRSWLYSNAL